MTLLLACLIIAGFHMPTYLYAVAVVVWMAHLTVWDRALQYVIERLTPWRP